MPCNQYTDINDDIQVLSLNVLLFRMCFKIQELVRKLDNIWEERTNWQSSWKCPMLRKRFSLSKLQVNILNVCQDWSNAILWHYNWSLDIAVTKLNISLECHRNFSRQTDFSQMQHIIWEQFWWSKVFAVWEVCCKC